MENDEEISFFSKPSEKIGKFCEDVVNFHLSEHPKLVTYYLYRDAFFQYWLNSGWTFEDHGIN
jgi:hypothetical protein